MPFQTLSSLEEAELKRKKVLVRVDFNVPLENQNVCDDTRIRKSLPTINYLLENKASVILCSHLGRPKGRFNPDMKLDSVASCLSGILQKEVRKMDDCVGKEVLKTKKALKESEILMLENTRFHNGEIENNIDFSKDLASGCDLFVQEAFGSIHRSHASTVGVAQILPSYAGFLVKKEVDILSKILKDPGKPFILVTGGAKIDTKIGVIRHFLKISDKILIGGGLANTFLYAQGYEVGKSLCEKGKKSLALDLLEESEKMGGKIILPTDVKVAKSIDDTDASNLKIENVKEDDMILDIGEESIEEFKKYIKTAKAIVFNGPLGLFEKENFQEGTRQVTKQIAASNYQTIIGGGDTIEAIEKFHIIKEQFSHISTGGGAMLEFLEGKLLPGLAVLKRR